MASNNSIYGKLDKVRKPRVQITYDVETEGAELKKELPFVVGVLGDFSGDPTTALKPLKDRKFIQVDSDNFDEVMDKMAVGLQFKVENTLKGDSSEMAVELQFKEMDDFLPARVAQQVEPLRKLIETRNRLSDLLSKADRSEQLESLLERILLNTEELNALSKELGIEAPAEQEQNEEKPAN